MDRKASVCSGLISNSLQGSWKAPEALWIAMEYCAGGSVSDLMRAADAPLPEELIAFVTKHTLAGLAYLHTVGKVWSSLSNICGNCRTANAAHDRATFRGAGAAPSRHTFSKEGAAHC